MDTPMKKKMWDSLCWENQDTMISTRVLFIELRFRIKLPLPASMADKLLCGRNQLDAK